MDEIPFERHVWAEIDLDALRLNFRLTQQQAGEMPLCAVVKADAYGHGAIRCARVFAQEGAAWLAVSRLTEALELRRAGLGLPILILGRTRSEEHTSELQSRFDLVCRLLLEKKKKTTINR